MHPFSSETLTKLLNIVYNLANSLRPIVVTRYYSGSPDGQDNASGTHSIEEKCVTSTLFAVLADVPGATAGVAGQRLAFMAPARLVVGVHCQ